MPLAQRETRALSEGFSTVKPELLNGGAEPIAGGRQHVFELSAGKDVLRGLLQRGLGGTDKVLVHAEQRARLGCGKIVLGEEEAPRHWLIAMRPLDGAPRREGLEPVEDDVRVPVRIGE